MLVAYVLRDYCNVSFSDNPSHKILYRIHHFHLPFEPLDIQGQRNLLDTPSDCDRWCELSSAALSNLV